MQTRKLLFPLCASVNPSFPRPPLTLLVARFLATDTRSLHVRRGERGKKGATREMEIVTRETQTGNIGGTLISRLEKRGGRQTVIVSTSSESLLLLLERERERVFRCLDKSIGDQAFLCTNFANGCYSNKREKKERLRKWYPVILRSNRLLHLPDYE